MFGLEDQKKKKSGDFIFELERELKDKKMHAEIQKRVDDRIQQIKTILRSGKNQDDFDQLGVILHGYSSLLKVMGRFPRR